MLDIIINSLWLIIPAYCANIFPVLVKGKYPIDFKKDFVDGHRLLGDGKTIEGFFSGIIFGSLIGLLQIYLQPFIGQFYIFQFQHSLFTIILLSAGAMVGDLIGSFVKRRFGLERGAPAPILDQLDFMVFSLTAVSIIISIEVSWVIFLLIITPILHYSSNIFVYTLKLKDRPW
ncbi:MAG: CDP-2,3-bis-(O-geranylgeranyl)-sn-glycerol synthase [Candidatus Aenigmatarchaeota archaeon]|nr:MAG: CDP-2,3-bis-(O-geranylgeranyl)-sn-glycerol synthase [Candidatus Aenigmarchaeota archaeon]